MMLKLCTAILVIAAVTMPICQAAAALPSTAQKPSVEECYAASMRDYEAGNFARSAATALKCSRMEEAGEWEGRSVFLAAMAYAASGDVQNAAEQFELAAKKHPILADYALHLLAALYVDKGMNEEASGIFSRLARSYPQSPLAENSLLGAARADIELKRYADALESLKVLEGKKPGPGVTAEMKYLMVKAYEATAEPEQASMLCRVLWLEHPESPFADKAGWVADRLKEAGHDIPAPSLEERIKRAERLFDRQRYEKAAREFNAAADLMTEGSTDMEKARLISGKCRFRLRDYSSAAKEFEAAIVIGKDLNTAAEATHMLAWTYLRMGEGKLFQEKALECAKKFPQSPWSVESLIILGAEYTYNKDFDKAVEIFSGILSRFPESSKLPEVLWRLGWASFNNANYKDAAEELGRLVNRYPSSDLAPQALYWRARSLEEDGRKDEALPVYEKLRQEYGLSFYTLLTDGGHVISTEIAGEVQDDPEEFINQDPYPDPELVRAKELGIVGMKSEAVEEVKRVEQHYSESVQGLEMLTGIYGILDEYRRPLELASRLYRTRINTGKEGIPDSVLRMAFPLGYWVTVKPSALGYGTDPFLLLSIIREESHFDRCAVSSAGAVGLMQLMPKTALGLCRNLKIDTPTTASLMNECFNIPLGACYIASLVEKHNGRVVYALAEYNAGPAALQKWLKRMPDKPDDEFIEGISFPETRNYVKKVLRNYRIYRKLYKSQDPQAAVSLPSLTGSSPMAFNAAIIPSL